MVNILLDLPLSRTHLFFFSWTAYIICEILSISHFTPEYFIICFSRARAGLCDNNSLTTFRNWNMDITPCLKFVYIPISPGVPQMSFVSFSPGQDLTKGQTLHLVMSVLKVEVSVVQSCPTLRYPMVARQALLSMEYFQARILEWVAIPFSRGSSWPRDWTWFSGIAGRFFTIWDHSILKK